MAIKMNVDGLEEISEMLTELRESAPYAASYGLYDGAGVMAKALTQAAKAIKTAPFKWARPGQKRLPSPEEKQIVTQGEFGIAHFDKNGGEVNTSIGYDNAGYVNVNWNHMSSKARTNYKKVSMKGHAHNRSSFLKALSMGKGSQNSKPVAAVANAINSGTSFMDKQPFIRKGASAGKKKAEEAIRSTIERIFNEIIESRGKSA